MLKGNHRMLQRQR